MKCYLCNSTDIKKRKGQVRDDASIKIMECEDCGLVFLDNLECDNNSFYENDGMSNTSKNIDVYNYVSSEDTLKRFKEHGILFSGKSILDFGCGNGDFLMKLKKEHITDKLYASELNKKFHGFLDEHFTLYKELNEIPDDSLDYITLFHVLEHISDPLSILEELKKKLKKGGKIIIEVPSSNDALLSLYDSEPFSKYTYWSCHLFLFNQYTLEKLLKNLEMNIVYIKQYQRYPLSNHLYWLSQGKPGGHNIWKFLDDKILNTQYENKLAQLGQCDSLIAMVEK